MNNMDYIIDRIGKNCVLFVFAATIRVTHNVG